MITDNNFQQNEFRDIILWLFDYNMYIDESVQNLPQLYSVTQSAITLKWDIQGSGH